MKRLLSLIVIFSTLIIMTACGNKNVDTPEIKPELTQMRAICELATLECYYHNVAKFEETIVNKFWWDGYKHFWVEYEGVVRVGVDATFVTISIEDNDIVRITLPPAKVLGYSVNRETLNESSYFLDSKSNKITAEDEVEALRYAENEMLAAASNNKILLLDARQRAQKLLEDYVNNIGDCIGKRYSVLWVDVDENGNIPTTSIDVPDTTN